jgi:hypothetical protein
MVLHPSAWLPVNCVSTLEFRHRVAGPVIALGQRVRSLSGIVTRIPWPRLRRHATVDAGLLAIVCWSATLAITFAGPGDRSLGGQLRGADFVHFYTLGHAAASGHVDTLYDMTALHAAQVRLVPASAPELYPTVYPPQAALMFAPFSRLSYWQGLLIWNALTIALYALVVWSTWRRIGTAGSDSRLVFLAAAAFPPFVALVLYGQITIVIMAAFWCGWRALERSRPFLAGMAFGALALKPQFGIPLAAIVLACGEWRMLAGALSSAAAQAAAVWLMLGSTVLVGFAESLTVTLTRIDWLEPAPYMSHSLRAITRLLPNWIGVPVWAALVGIVLWHTIRIWKSSAPLRLRLGTVVVASILVNPHVIVYDVTLLALPLLWFMAQMQESERPTQTLVLGRMVYWLFAVLLVPTAPMIGVQMSVVLMCGLLIVVLRESGARAPATLTPRCR